MRRSPFDPWWRRPAAATAGAVFVAALAGWLLGGTLNGKPADPLRVPEIASTTGVLEGGGLELLMPVGWSIDRRPPRIAGSGIRHPIALLEDAEGVHVVAERLRATSSTLLPVGLVQRTRTGPAPPTEVRFADGLRGYRYAFTRRAGRSALVVDAAPTTTGIATVACLGKRITAARRVCDEVVGTVSVPAAQAVKLGETAAFDARLPETVRALARARRAARRTLAAARKPTAQARAATRLQRAFGVRAAALAPLVPKNGGTTADTLAQLRAAGAAYGRLAQAAKAGDRGAYAKASRAVIAAEQRLDALLAG